MRQTQKSGLAGAMALVLMAGPAFAHPGHVLEDGAMMAGLVHPLSGLDHVLAMLAVGLWAAQQGGRALWALPAAFVTTMLAGAGLALAGLSLPGVDGLILASVLVLGILVVMDRKIPLGAGLAITGLFALSHGFAHGLEMPAATTAMAYGAGFAVATALLHGVGLVAGTWLLPGASARRQLFSRLAGALITGGGVLLAASAL